MVSPQKEFHPSKGDLVAHDESPIAGVLAAGKKGMILLTSRGINMLSQFCLVLVISRFMGQEALGVFSFVLSTTILGTFVSNFGLDTLATREVAGDPGKGRELVSNILGLKLCTSSIAFIIVNLSFLFSGLDPSTQEKLLIYSISIFFISTMQLLWFYGDAFERFTLHGVLWASNNVLRAVIATVILLLGGSLGTALAGMVIADSIGLFISWVVINKQVGRVRFAAQWAQWKAALQKAWPIAVYGMLGAIGFRIDVVILQVLKGPQEVGLYSAAFKLVEVMHVVPSSLSLVYFPRFSRVFVSDGARGTSRLLKHLVIITGCSGLVLCTLLYLAAPVVIQILYGSAFIDSTAPLRILVLKMFLMFATLPLSYGLIAMGQERPATYLAAVAAAVNIAANLLLIGEYGRIGAAWASVLAEIVILAGFGLCIWRIVTRRVRPA